MTDALFPRAAVPAYGSVPGGLAGRLLALADLINEAVDARDTPRERGLARQAAIETTPGPRSPRLPGLGPRALRPAPVGPVDEPEDGEAAGRHRPLPGGHRPRPGNGAAEPPEPGAGDGTPDDSDAMEQAHAETWRLVRLAQAGDGEAFGALYDRYVDTVFRFIFFRVNDRALAEDFTSETFLRALRRIGSISYQGRDIGAWFITIARNIVLDHVKSARNRLEVVTADTIEGREHIASTEAAVLESLQSERLLAAVKQLGAEQRECVTLRFIQGMSVSETAALMGKNDGAIKALQHRAVRKLADLVGRDLR